MSEFSSQLAKDEKALQRISNAIAIYKYSAFEFQQRFESGAISDNDRKTRELDLTHRTLNKIVSAMDIRSGAKFDNDDEPEILPEHVVEYLAMQANHLAADE